MLTMAELAEIRQQVVLSCRFIGRLGLTRETNGHVSARLPGDRLLIKARGRAEAALSFVEGEDLAVVDMDGKLLEGREGLASPAEVYIHTCIYRARPRVGSVIHIHPPAVVAFTIAGKSLLPIIGAFNPSALRLVLDGLPVYPRSILINSEERGRDLVQAMGSARACLMRGHGITTAGVSVEEATLTAIHLNQLAELQLKAEMLGGAQPISDEDLADFESQAARGAAQAGAPGAEWRYYERLFGG
jgi:ribulose-5-phosphate 4-epimerase/fuculose-1-phosphate aldolase